MDQQLATELRALDQRLSRIDAMLGALLRMHVRELRRSGDHDDHELADAIVHELSAQSITW
jgi:hypothetical protein